MAYLGRGIENLSDRVVLDDITTSATATYNLTLNSVAFVPSSSESLTVSLNGVVQKNGGTNPSFTVSGSQIIFSSALTSSDSIDFIIAERGITLQTPSAGSVGTSQLASTAVTTAKIADDAVTFDKMTGQNYPAFSVYLNATSSNILSATFTKVTSFVEEYDTDSAFASDKFTVPSGKAGKYMIQAQARFNVSGSTSNVAVLKIQVNGSDGSPIHIENANFCNGSGNVRLHTNGIYDLSVGDYVEMVVYQNITTANLLANTTWFQGHRIGD